MLCLWGILTFLFLLASLALNLCLQVGNFGRLGSQQALHAQASSSNLCLMDRQGLRACSTASPATSLPQCCLSELSAGRPARHLITLFGVACSSTDPIFPAMQLLFLLLTVTFFLLARGQKVSGVAEVGGWFGIVTAGVAIYTGFAELFNETVCRVSCIPCVGAVSQGATSQNVAAFVGMQPLW